MLRHLMLPRLRVNSMDGSVGMTDGSSVQLCINGRKATKEEVTALLPEEVYVLSFKKIQVCVMAMQVRW